MALVASAAELTETGCAVFFYILGTARGRLFSVFSTYSKR